MTSPVPRFIATEFRRVKALQPDRVGALPHYRRHIHRVDALGLVHSPTGSHCDHHTVDEELICPEQLGLRRATRRDATAVVIAREPVQG